MDLREYAARDAVGLAALVRSGEVSAAEVEDAARRAIDAVDAALGATVGPLLEPALEAGDAGPLPGVAAAREVDGFRHIDTARVEEAIQRRALLYDKGGEEHYNIISALHKSMRNSDPDAAVYWLARMLEAGEDPLYIARRLVRFASEDIGNADPQALTVAVAAKDAVHFIGMPEGNTALAQAAIYLATAPKSNAVYEAYTRTAQDAHRDVAEPVPLHLRNAPTKLMKDLDYGKGYKYAHHEANAVADMSCLPPSLEGRKYYEPKERGFEKEIKRRLDGWEELKRKLKLKSEK